MKNDKLLSNYKEEVLELFISHYKKMSAKELDLEFSSVLHCVLAELGISQFSSNEVYYLEEWFNNIHHQVFVKNIIHAQNGDQDIEEVIFHSHQAAQILSRHQKKVMEIEGLTLPDYQLSFEMFALRNNIAWNFSEPFASFSASIGGIDLRVTLIHHSTSANRKSKVFLRYMQKKNPTLDLFKENQEIKELLIGLIRDKKNILISGSTGSGKTTFMRSLLSEIPQNEHVIVLEDTHEIMTFSPNQTSLLSQNELSKKSLVDYCAYALRMSPDRLVIGEMRSNEVVPFMLAMNTGHTGLMSTIHANSAVDALSRIALLFSLYSENKEIDFSLITKLACKNIQYVIHMEDKSISEICRVIGSEGETPFYEKIYQKNENN